MLLAEIIMLQPARAILSFIVALPLALSAAASAAAGPAGYEHLVTPDGTEVGVWYPSDGTPTDQRIGLFVQHVVPGGDSAAGQHPLVVISHGTGGDYAGHVDTAVALAQAGFIVAALTHPGDNWHDNSRATRIEDRPKALSALITYMLGTWHDHTAIDAQRIGAFGFSSGGFTVLAAAGGRPDLARIASHCANHAQAFDCQLIQSQPRTIPPAWPDLHDMRIKAIVVAAPALGFTFDRAGLSAVTIPVQLWRADSDHILPAPDYADAVRAALPTPPEFHTVPGADHFDFLAPCAAPAAMPMLCHSTAPFDRNAFHARFDADIVRFFTQTLMRDQP
jgi:predicted dienelactone hydrolase